MPDDFYERVDADVRQRIARAVREAHSVLDLGCGGCSLDEFLAERNGQRVVGVDLVADGFPDPETRAANVDCRQSDARQLDFLDDNSIDAIVCVYALHEMANPRAVLAEALRVLRPGGILVIVDYPENSLAQRLWNENYRTVAEVTAWLEDAGFTVLDCRLVEKGQLLWARGQKESARG